MFYAPDWRWNCIIFCICTHVSRSLVAAGKGKNWKTATENSASSSTCPTEESPRGWNTNKVNMQGVYIKSLMWTTYRKANGIQSNIPRHCTTSFSSIIQGVVHFRIWASNANWWVKVSLLECLKYKHEKQPQKKINQDTLYGPAQTWSAKTLHIFWWSGSGKGGETMKTNKSWTCFSHAYDFHYAYRCGPFFCLDFLIVDLCLQQKEGTKVRGFPFLVAHCLQTFYRVTHLSMTTESPAVIGDWCA